MNSKKTMDFLKYLKSVIAESPERHTEKLRIWSKMATDFRFNCGSLARSSCPHLISPVRHKNIASRGTIGQEWPLNADPTEKVCKRSSNFKKLAISFNVKKEEIKDLTRKI